MFEVFKKELRELLRDKKTLMFVVALPVLIFPIIFGTLGYFMAQAHLNAEQEVHTYSIVGDENATGFSESVFYHKNFKLQNDLKFNSKEELENAVTEGLIDLGIYISSQPIINDKKKSTVKIEVIYNNSSRVNYITEKINKIFSAYKILVQHKNLKDLGITKQQEQDFVLLPIELELIDSSNARESFGEKIGILLPYLLIPIVLTGASYPAIDLGAGEKERGTLETLLLTPITRTHLVIGKFITILTASLATSLITVISLGTWMYIAKQFISISFITDAIELIGTVDLILILLLLIPLACIFSSLVLAISIYAKTFKEAQNYMGPLSILTFFPLAISMMPNMELNVKTSLIPIVNISLAIRELLKGTVEYNHVYLIIGSTSIIAIISILFCVKWFNKEEVLFR
ncbi:ABC transporter permease [Pseudoalteromonas distincta]|uniref:ABC transporter permease n=1 Tax=Pseudoalteromonas distincta TaxID=77608 RepID=UPI00186A6205|nr:ABC transporter permease [Pseudoalteromonas distincta]MBE3674071.1 sodium transport system permease protein [Pseudoalteromonas distincta KMM 3548]MDC3211258.1 ABC transporter permease [Pseudoalteromonas distincta]